MNELVFITDASEGNAKLFRNNDDALILSVSDFWGKKNSRQEDREVQSLNTVSSFSSSLTMCY